MLAASSRGCGRGGKHRIPSRRPLDTAASIGRTPTTSTAQIPNVHAHSPICSPSISHLKPDRYRIVQMSSRQLGQCQLAVDNGLQAAHDHTHRSPFFPPITCALSILATILAMLLSSNSTHASVKLADWCFFCFFSLAWLGL